MSALRTIVIFGNLFLGNTQLADDIKEKIDLGTYIDVVPFIGCTSNGELIISGLRTNLVEGLTIPEQLKSLCNRSKP